MEVNAVVYEYTGFGESNGKIPIDQSLYDDIETVYIYLTENLNIDPNTILVNLNVSDYLSFCNP